MKILPRLSVLALTYLAIPFFASAQIAPSGIFRELPTPTPQPSPSEAPVVATPTTTETPPVAVKPEKKAVKAGPKPPAKTPRTPPVVADDKRPSGNDAGTVSKLRQMQRKWKASSHNTATIPAVIVSAENMKAHETENGSGRFHWHNQRGKNRHIEGLTLPEFQTGSYLPRRHY